MAYSWEISPPFDLVFTRYHRLRRSCKLGSWTCANRRAVKYHVISGHVTLVQAIFVQGIWSLFQWDKLFSSHDIVTQISQFTEQWITINASAVVYNLFPVFPCCHAYLKILDARKFCRLSPFVIYGTGSNSICFDFHVAIKQLHFLFNNCASVCVDVSFDPSLIVIALPLAITRFKKTAAELILLIVDILLFWANWLWPVSFVCIFGVGINQHCTTDTW